MKIDYLLNYKKVDLENLIAKFAYVGKLLYVKEDFLLTETRLYYSRETENEENPLEEGRV